MNAELVLDVKASLGEGAIWDERRRRLLWVDIFEKTVFIFDPETNSNQSFTLDRQVGTVVPCRDDRLLVALENGFAILNPDTGDLETVAQPEIDCEGTRFNDGKCDPAGRFWAGTLSYAQRPEANLWRLDEDLSMHKMLDGVICSNGIVWSLDASTMYYIDTPTRQVAAFDYDQTTGTIRNRRAVVDVPESMGMPDGMTIDARGMLWIALWEGSQVGCWDPDEGKLLDTINLPASRVTSCAFGGADLNELYITTARTGASEEELAMEPTAGGLFRARPGVHGVIASEFGGP